jgi:hypothetical protein
MPTFSTIVFEMGDRSSIRPLPVGGAEDVLETAQNLLFMVSMDIKMRGSGSLTSEFSGLA